MSDCQQFLSTSAGFLVHYKQPRKRTLYIVHFILPPSLQTHLSLRSTHLYCKVNAEKKKHNLIPTHKVHTQRALPEKNHSTRIKSATPENKQRQTAPRTPRHHGKNLIPHPTRGPQLIPAVTKFIIPVTRPRPPYTSLRDFPAPPDSPASAPLLDTGLPRQHLFVSSHPDQ